MDRNQLKQDMIKSIAEAGLVLVPLLDRSGETPTVVHTVGLMDKGWPDLIIMGPDIRLSNAVIAYVMDFLEQNGPQPDMTMIQAPHFEAPKVYLRDVPVAILAKMPVAAAHVYYENRPFMFQQIVLADGAGNYPWDEGYGVGMLSDKHKMTQEAFWKEGVLEQVAPIFVAATNENPSAGMTVMGMITGAELFGEEACDCLRCTAKRAADATKH